MVETEETERHGARAVINGCIDACRQCEDLIAALTPEQYRQAIEGHSAIGAHLRHSVDHYTSLFAGLEANRIDYDARKRDPRIETDPNFAGAMIAEIIRRLEELSLTSFEQSLSVAQTADGTFHLADVPSTLGRELMYASSHTIHHLALVRLLAERIGVQLPQHIGLAYSTAAYRLSQASA